MKQILKDNPDIIPKKMNILIRILIIKLLLFSTLIYCQNNTLDNFRIHNCKKNVKYFQKN